MKWLALKLTVEEYAIKLSVLKLSAGDDYIRVETCTDPCGPNRSDEAASTAADDDYIRVETCTDPCGTNRSHEAASTAADDDYMRDDLKAEMFRIRLVGNSCFPFSTI